MIMDWIFFPRSKHDLVVSKANHSEYTSYQYDKEWLLPAMNEEIKQASEIANDPLSVSYATYAWVLVLSIWGGVVRIMREIKFGSKTKKEIVLFFFSELLTSGFAGLLTFYACTRASFDPMYSAVMVGMSGYMGGRALSWLEEIYKGRQRRKEDNDQ